MITVCYRKQMNSALITRGCRRSCSDGCRESQWVKPNIREQMLIVGVGSEALPRPFPVVQKAADCANFIPGFVVFNNAFSHSVNVSGVVIKIPN
jgi:hypothetical protein